MEINLKKGLNRKACMIKEKLVNEIFNWTFHNILKAATWDSKNVLPKKENQIDENAIQFNKQSSRELNIDKDVHSFGNYDENLLAK